MKFPVFQLVNFGIILILLIFLIRYAWDLFFGSGYCPAEWAQAKKNGRIDKRLLHLRKTLPGQGQVLQLVASDRAVKERRYPG